MDSQTSGGAFKRKKKRMSTYQRAMKFSKRGKFGHGFQIQDEDFQYFLNILKVSKETFESDDDKCIFVDNVFKQLHGNEVNYCSNQVVSRVVDDLLPAASDHTVLNLIKHFESDLRPICCDQFASHVLQQLLHVAIYRAYKVTKDVSETTKENYFNFINKLCKFIINNLEEFIWDTYANHIVRSCIACLCGQPYLCSKTPQQKGENIDTNKEHKDLLKKYADCIVNIQQFSEMPTTDITSGLLQVLLKSISPVSKKRFKALVEKIMSGCFPISESTSFDNISQVFENNSCSRLLDVIISESPEKLNKLLYEKYFNDKLADLTVHHNGNFTIQKILSTTADPTKFETIFDQLKEKIPQIINLGYTGVLLELSNACLRLKCKQALFFKTLCESLKCKEETEDGVTVLLLLGLKVADNFDNLCKEPSIHIHGSMIVQNILKFNKPIKMVNNLNNLDTERLVYLLSDVKGSYIGNAYFESAFIGERSREKMIWKLKDYYTTLAKSKSGSRAFDCIWKVADTKQRTMIMTEFLKHESELTSTQFGSIIASKLNLGMFRHKRDEWIKADQDKLQTLYKIEREEVKKPSQVDRIFKQALREFKENLIATYSVANKQGNGQVPNIKYKDLIANFLHVIETVCGNEKIQDDFPVTLCVNAFRGFMNEFMSQNRVEIEKPSKTKRKKQKKQKSEDHIIHGGHVLQISMINIPTACEVCTSFFLWPIERSLVCRNCKLTCHKKCYTRANLECLKDMNSSTANMHSKGICVAKGKVFGRPLGELDLSMGKVPAVVECLITISRK